MRCSLSAKRILAPLLYRHVPPNLQPERLYLYLDHIWRLRSIDGAVLEVGCAIGGTAILAYKMLRRTGQQKPYVCVDTFGGFPADQFEADQKLGLSERHRHSFAALSLPLVRSVLDAHGGREIALIQGDIAKMSGSLLPERISLCLMDVDLTEPTHFGLKRVYPRLASGGVILVDDCGDYADHDSWRARIGYARFCAELGVPEEYVFDMGIIRRSPTSSH